MKIKNGLLSLFLSAGLLSNAQFTNTKVAELEKFKSAGTAIVAISDDEATNKSVEQIMAAYWKASKYQVIKQSELEAFVKTNPENYVLTYINNNDAHVLYSTRGNRLPSQANGADRSRTVIIGDGLMLTKNVKKIKKLKPTDAMLYTFIDPDMELVSSEAEFIRQVGTLNSILMHPGLKDDQIGGWKVPTYNYKAVTSKELWITDADLNKKGEDEAKMTAAYRPFKYKVVSKEEMAKAIIEKKQGVVYAARPEYQAGAYMFVVHSTEDGKALFSTPGTGGFDAKALEKIKNNKVYGQ